MDEIDPSFPTVVCVYKFSAAQQQKNKKSPSDATESRNKHYSPYVKPNPPSTPAVQTAYSALAIVVFANPTPTS